MKPCLRLQMCIIIPLDTLRFAFRRYAFHLKDEAIDYMIDRQDSQLIEPTMYRNIGALLQCETPVYIKIPQAAI